MIILSINDATKAANVNKLIQEGKDIFILIYMEGCGPCNATRPEWAKIKNALKSKYAKNNSLVVIDINKDYISNLNVGSVDGFPTMKYIGNNGKTIENYENSNINRKDRSVNSFILWIESKINKKINKNNKNNKNKSSALNVYKRLKHNMSMKNKIKKTIKKILKTRKQQNYF
jgi:thiol-disulfide isomerase/thioredoxin